MDHMFPCDVCGSEYPSKLGASYCCDPDDDKANRYGK